jgi:hypothetical protein
MCWQDPYNNPLVREFNVQMLRVEEDKWVDLGNTTKDYIRIDAADYDIRTSYQIRIATIGINRRRSAWSYSQTFIASPLRFDFSSINPVRLPTGEAVQSQRLLFLLF